MIRIEESDLVRSPLGPFPKNEVHIVETGASGKTADQHARVVARDPEWTIPVPKARKGKQYVWVTPYEDVAVPLMIRQARQRKGLSQRALAKKLSMSVQQLQELECPGKSNPTVRTLAAVSRALDEQLRVELVA